MKEVRKIIASIQETNNFQQALTHSSACNEDKSLISYETLEFLGDSILGMQVSLYIYSNYPHFSEGQMSKLKHSMVRESTLAHLSREIGLNKTDKEGKLEYLKLGEGEIKNGGIDKVSILSDIFESFVAALYFEKGDKAVLHFLELTLFAWIKGKENITWDYKSQLQVYCQAQKINIVYRSVKGEEESSSRHFFVRELILGKGFGSAFQVILKETGKGKSKKEAEQHSATKALKRLGLIDT